MEEEISRQLRHHPKVRRNSMADVKEKIQGQLDQLSNTDLEIVNNFIEAIKARKFLSADMYLLSESALVKDWLRPEEDQAWNNL